MAATVSAPRTFCKDDYPCGSLHHDRRACNTFGTKERTSVLEYRSLAFVDSIGATLSVFTSQTPFVSVQGLDWIMGRGICE